MNMLLKNNINKHAVWLVIEEIFDIALDLEDLNQVLEELDQKSYPFEYDEASKKRDEIIVYLNKRLYLFLKQDDSGNQYFPYLLGSNKGIKLISRLIKLVSADYVYSILSLMFLNLHLLHDNKLLEENILTILFHNLCRFIPQYDYQILSLLFFRYLFCPQNQNTLLAFYSSKAGCIILSAILNALHPLVNNKNEWKELFNKFYQSFQNKFLEISNKFSQAYDSECFWQLLASICLHSSQDKRNYLFSQFNEGISKNLMKSTSPSLKQISNLLNIK